MHGTMARPRFGFDRLLAPVTRASFFETYYEDKPLILHRAESGYYADVLGLDDVWDFIETRAPGPETIKLIKLGAPPQPSDWLGPSGRADPVRVAAMYDDGYTVALNKMHEHFPALGALCAAAEAVFSCPFQTNLYMTPPNAQGFMPHWDTHDVFVLQTHGSKNWTLYDTPIELPLKGQSFDDEKPEPGPVSAQFTLRAGDLLYCPRGLMHSATSSSEMSLHITLGVMGRTWSELLVEAVSKLALEEPSLRRNLPANYARPDFDLDAASATVRGLMMDLAQRGDFSAALAGFRDTFVATRPRRLPGHAAELRVLDSLHSNDRVRVRPDLLWLIDVSDGMVRLCCGGTDLSLPDFTEAAVRAALAPGGFVVGALPGPLDEAGKLTLVRRLVREGLLVTNASGAA